MSDPKECEVQLLHSHHQHFNTVVRVLRSLKHTRYQTASAETTALRTQQLQGLGTLVGRHYQVASIR